tara:strand:- start:1963 stop:2337 length:375 start_codon:yes stop_codon:yes gene_type:complete
MNIKKIENMAAIVMIIAFFLPWVSMGIFSISGLKASTLGGGAFMLFLIPLFSVGVLASDAMKLDENMSKYLTYGAGLVPLGYVLSRLFSMGSDFFTAAAVGIYLTLLASVAMLLAAFGIIKIPE